MAALSLGRTTPPLWNTRHFPFNGATHAALEHPFVFAEVRTRVPSSMRPSSGGCRDHGSALCYCSMPSKCCASYWLGGRARGPCQSRNSSFEFGRPERKPSCRIARNATAKVEAMSRGSAQDEARSQSSPKLPWVRATLRRLDAGKQARSRFQCEIICRATNKI